MRWLSVLGASLLKLFGLRYGPAPDRVVVERVSVAVDGLAPQLDGLTIGVLSDLHLGPLVREGFIRAAAERLAALRPDLMVVTGDFLSVPGAAGLLPEVLGPVAGAYAIPGNWDVFAGTPRTWGGLRWLVNRGVEAAPGLWLCGVDDVNLGRPDLEAAVAGAPAGAVRVLLCHEPDFADEVRPEHQVALQVSGHSHGGQIRLPLLPPLLLPRRGRRYVAGLYRAGGCWVYTTRGLGVAHLPFRWGCPPEVTLVTLTSARVGAVVTPRNAGKER